jgi:uncharacterized protein YjbI with pentapeptide repeats
MDKDKKLHIKQQYDSGLEDQKLWTQSSWNEIRIEVGLFIRRLWRQIGFEDKTLWDWLQLGAGVAVPVVLFFAGQAIQERSQTIADANRRQEIRIAGDERNQEILSTYLEDVTKLLLNENLRHSEDNSEVQVVARIKTLNAVRRLDGDGESKGQLLKFLYEADLIGKCQIKDQIKCGNRRVAILHLNDARLDQASVPSTALFPGIDLNDARLSKATLAGIDLTNAQLQRANLQEANLDSAVLSDANLASASLTDAHLLGAKMYRSILESARLENADLSNAVLINAKLSGAVLKGAKLDHANLQNADLASADLRNVSLDGASLQSADLRNANLDGTSLQNADLKGAKYSNTTQFSRDFDPGEKGMISVQ